jgi:hypothetical protein
MPAKSGPFDFSTRLWCPPAFPELARGIAAEEIAFQHAGAHDEALARGDAFIVEGRARRALRLERPLLDVHTRREHLLAQAVDEEAGLAIEVAAVHRGDEVADQADRDRRLEQHRRLAGGDLARAQARGGALGGVAAERTRLGDLRRHARAGIPVVALHQALLLGDHRAGEVMPRARIAGDEAEAVGQHKL